jgi:nitrite reductase/ring-hydroxylating ferredoxin subunit
MPDEITYAFCRLEELKVNGSMTKWVDSLRDEVTAVLDGDDIRVMSSVCPHFGGEFEYDPNERQLVCKWHSFKFDVKTGHCKYPSAKLKLRQYSFRLVDGMLEILAQ